MRRADRNALGGSQQRFNAAKAAQRAQHQQERADNRQCDLRQVGEHAGRGLDAHGGPDAPPAQTRMREHAGHQVAVDGVEDQHEVQDKQRHVTFARVFQNQRRHHTAHEQIGRIPVAGALRS